MAVALVVASAAGVALAQQGEDGVIGPDRHLLGDGREIVGDK